MLAVGHTPYFMLRSFIYFILTTTLTGGLQVCPVVHMRGSEVSQGDNRQWREILIQAFALQSPHLSQMDVLMPTHT